MKTAIRVPKTSMAARPMSLMIFSSWRMESWPRRRPHSVMSSAKNTRLYSTRSRTVSRKVFAATARRRVSPDASAFPAPMRATKYSSRDWRTGCTPRIRPSPPPPRARSPRAAAPRPRGSSDRRRGCRRSTPRARDRPPPARPPTRTSSGRRPWSGSRRGAPTCSSRPPRRSATRSQRLSASDEDVGREEHRLARLLEVEDDPAHQPAPERIEPRHRLVEEHELGVVQRAPARAPPAGVMPLEYRRSGRSADSASPTRASISRERSRLRAAVMPNEAARVVEVLARGQVVVEIRVLGQVSGAVAPRPRAEGVSEDGRRPRVGERRPMRIFSVVVLPEPLGPR